MLILLIYFLSTISLLYFFFFTKQFFFFRNFIIPLPPFLWPPPSPFVAFLPIQKKHYIHPPMFILGMSHSPPLKKRGRKLCVLSRCRSLKWHAHLVFLEMHNCTFSILRKIKCIMHVSIPYFLLNTKPT